MGTESPSLIKRNSGSCRTNQMCPLICAATLLVIIRDFLDALQNIPSLYKVTVRLSDGGSSNQGRVELKINGLWGTVTDSDWDNKDGDVVCRMLGLPAATGTPGGAIFGQGTGMIWLAHVECFGNESSLISCGNVGGLGAGKYYSSSGHADDASVICGEPAGELLKC